MSFPERPPLHSITCEQIDMLLHKVDERHWPQIVEMRVKNYHPPGTPVPPQTPDHLRQQIHWYASMLFKTEADQYEQFRSDARYGGWLSSLADRTKTRVMKALEKLENSDTNVIHNLVGIRGGLILGYHGLTTKGVEEELHTLLSELRDQYQQGNSEVQRNAERFSRVAKDAAAAGVDLSSASPLLKMALNAASQGSVIETSPNNALKAKRKSLLDSYREKFPDVKLADIQWAAKQTRREWTRWLGGEAKDGSKPDRTFRHVLTSGKTPEQIMGKPRPTKYSV